MPVGEVEIVFTGLCSFLNLRNLNGALPDPSVVLPRTSRPFQHVPYIAFDTREVEVPPPDISKFAVVESTNGDFRFRALGGDVDHKLIHELSIEEDVPRWPNVLASYDLIANKDVYWPEARNKWATGLVPVGNNPQLDREKVAAFMYFGGGAISAERMTDFPWEFRELRGAQYVPTVRDYYAQELVYRIYPYQPLRTATTPGKSPCDELTITLRTLGQSEQETYTFISKREGAHKIKLWIGNNDAGDIHRALLRLSSRPRPAVHFSYLNRVAEIDPNINPSNQVIGPVPMPLVPRRTFPPEVGPGGSDTGYCGPHNAGA